MDLRATWISIKNTIDGKITAIQIGSKAGEIDLE